MAHRFWPILLPNLGCATGMEQLQLHCLSFLKNEMMDITKMSRQEVAPAVDGLL